MPIQGNNAKLQLLYTRLFRDVNLGLLNDKMIIHAVFRQKEANYLHHISFKAKLKC